MPDYSSRGTVGAASLPNVDGLLSWEAWTQYQNNVPEADEAVCCEYTLRSTDFEADTSKNSTFLRWKSGRT
jgi:hypothetical protein